MPATITRGTTFTAGQQNVSVAVWNPVLTSATIANIDRDNILLTANTLATMQAAAPNNPQPSEVWQDNISHFLKAYLSGAWKVAYPFGAVYTLSSTQGRNVLQGDVLALTRTPNSTGTYEVARAGVPNWQKASAVAIEDTALGGTGRLIRHGVCRARAFGTIAAGDALAVADSDGLFSSVSPSVGYGPQIKGVALSANSGGYVWTCLRY